jgi:hypothetical protein
MKKTLLAFWLRMQSADFLECLVASIVCIAWQGMYKCHKGGCSVVLEAVANQDLWIWHAFFGMVGSHNDINVLQCSNVFSRLVEGHAAPVNFVINGHE